MAIATAIIGVSGWGDVHYEDLLRATERGLLRPCAATIINQDEEAEKVAHLQALGCMVYSDYESMFSYHANELQLCLIPTGIPLHRVMTEAALRYDIHVFVEKPAAGTVQDVQAMIDAETASAARVAVGFQRMFDPMTQTIKAALCEGVIGTVQTVRGFGLWPRNDAYYARNAWAGQAVQNKTWILDSPINNALSHYVMLSCFFAGSTRDAASRVQQVEAELYRCRPIGNFDTACLRAQMESGVEVSFHASHACSQQVQPHISIQGTTGTARWYWEDDVTECAIIESRAGTQESPVMPTHHKGTTSEVQPVL